MSETTVVTEYAGTSKQFRVKCDTCRLTQTYYTEVGVRYFKSQHTGHRVGVTNPLASSPSLEDTSLNESAATRDAPDVSIGREGLATIQVVKESYKSASPKMLLERTLEKEQPRMQNIPTEGTKRDLVKKEAPLRAKVTSENSAPSKNGDLLLGKFSFVKAGCAEEALRVSRVLKGFRWKVEPPYVIGAIFDDNLSILSNTGVISREMIMGIEQIGYYFVAVESPNCVTTAWFKKETAGESTN